MPVRLGQKAFGRRVLSVLSHGLSKQTCPIAHAFPATHLAFNAGKDRNPVSGDTKV
jgi:hypothetical protein